MKQALSCLALAGLLGCRPSAADPAATDSLVGTWQLTSLRCYCPAGWLPTQTLTFDASQHFQLFVGGQLAAAGSYALSQGALCSQAPSQPLLTLTPTASRAYAPSGVYTLRGNQLIIDEGRACLADAPVGTYQRQ